jgi:hypothetical protein
VSTGNDRPAGATQPRVLLLRCRLRESKAGPGHPPRHRYSRSRNWRPRPPIERRSRRAPPAAPGVRPRPRPSGLVCAAITRSSKDCWRCSTRTARSPCPLQLAGRASMKTRLHRGMCRLQLAEAVRRTFERRGTALPTTPRVGLTEAFARAWFPQWRTFLTRERMAAVPEHLDHAASVEQPSGSALQALVSTGHRSPRGGH